MKKTGLLFASLVSLAAMAQEKTNYYVADTFHIQSAGGWDYLAVNQGKIYVSHGTQVNILDEQTGDSLGVIPNTNGVHGIAFNNALKHGYTSNGRANTVTVFDLSTNKLISDIATGENPDAILYDGFSKTIITCNGRGKSLSVIDPVSNKVVATIDVAGKPETAVSDGAGKIFVNIEDKNEIAVVDIAKRAVVSRWSLSPGEGPAGLAYDVKTKRLFSGCEELLIVMDATNGKIIDKIKIGAGCDGVAFDNKRKRVFTSNGSGTITVVQEKNAEQFSVLENVPTKRGARTIAIDETRGEIFIPTADFEPAAEGVRPKMKAGTFQVLVVKEVKS